MVIHRPGNTLPRAIVADLQATWSTVSYLWCTINRDTIARYCLAVSTATGKNRARQDVMRLVVIIGSVVVD